MKKIFKKVFGTYSDKELKRIKPTVEKIIKLEEKYSKMSESDLRSQTNILRNRLKNRETLKDILPDAFAVCREASNRVLKMKHFKSQIIGGIVLSQGRIAEMKTGEGKTLVATLPAYLYGIEGKGTHVVTVNDYLAKRDADCMGKVYRYLGLTVGVIINSMDNNERRKAYACDITYGTNNEIGFDYLRDNMCTFKEQQVQRKFNYALVDEVDSILIDEARTPLIISGAGEKSTDLYSHADNFARTLKVYKIKELDDKEDHEDVDGDYIIDEKAKTATLTSKGVKKAEKFFGIGNLMDIENVTLLHHVNQAIRAHGIMKRNIDYVVKNGKVLIVDEFTGRIMNGRRYNEGLHQALEAKENVEIANESKTLATITFQNLFRLYRKLSGMTGTALTEEGEFREIYKLDIVEIPTNRPVQRKDHHDVIYKTERAKFNAVIKDITECNKKGQPVLVGTISIAKSEILSSLLKQKKINHSVLNAKYHDQEAKIVAQAGKKGAVTIATNMAGRGTDIVLGGNAEYMAKDEMSKRGFDEELINEATSFSETDDEEILSARKIYGELYEKYKKITSKEAIEVKNAGGLFIIGTERHESRRIDNQLRGRSGRQGDPGESRFYLSLEDDLMRLFGGEKIDRFMTFLKADEDMPIQSRLLTKAIANAQEKVEGRNFETRKSVIKFDDVMNTQRKTIYEQRAEILEGKNMDNYVTKIIKSSIRNTVDRYIFDSDIHENWNIEGLKNFYLSTILQGDELNFKKEELSSLSKQKISDILIEKALKKYEERKKVFGEDRMNELEQMLILKTVDAKWTAHLDNMEELRKGIYLRSYAQKDPVIEYRIEGFDMFDEMIATIKEEITRLILSLKTSEERWQEQTAKDVMKLPIVISKITSGFKPKPRINRNKIGRNDPCPCKSGKKYKECCGLNSENSSED